MKKNLQFKIMHFCNGLVFFAPVATLLRTNRGVTLSQFFLLQALLSVMIFILEIPTGMITDRIGYKKGILLSQITLFIARAIFLFANNISYFIVEAILEAFASCFMSGTSEAYLYEMCHENKSEDFFLEESAKVNACGTAGFIFSTICYAFLYHFTDLNGLVIATEAASFIAILAVIFMPTESTKNIVRDLTEANHAKKADKKKSIRNFMPKLPPVLWKFMMLDSMIGLTILIINFLYVEKLTWSGIPIEWMTPIILGYSALDLLIPKVITICRKRKDASVYRVFSLIGGLLFIGIFLVNHFIGIALMIFAPFLLNIVGMIQYKYENQAIDALGLENNRATMLSMMNMGNHLLEIIFLLLSAVISSNQGNELFLFAGILILILSFAGGKFISKTDTDANKQQQ